ncbi:MAG: hypothetical protein ABFD89_02520 [Bryobacteraceae bacterium]
MRQKTRQIKFHCSEEQFEALQTIKLEWNISTQQLMTEALDMAIIAHRVAPQIELEIKRDRELDLANLKAYDCTFTLKEGELPWVQLWLDCLWNLPDATLLAFRQLMHDSLKFFKSSRLKSRKISKGLPDV